MKRNISQIAKIVFISLNILVISSLPSYAALAMGGDYDPSPVYTSNCINFYNNLKYRSTDANSNNEVSKLQEILQEKGYLSAGPTGYFGKLTLSGVKSFQSSYGLDQTGYVGTLTRAKLKEISCGTIPVIPTYYPACNPNINYFAQQNCTCQNGSVVSAYTSCSEYYYYNYNTNYNNYDNTQNTYCNYDSYGQMYCY